MKVGLLIIGATMTLSCSQGFSSEIVLDQQLGKMPLQSPEPTISYAALMQVCMRLNAIKQQADFKNQHLEVTIKFLQNSLNATNHELKRVSQRSKELAFDLADLQERYNNLMFTHVSDQCYFVNAQRKAQKLSHRNRKLKNKLKQKRKITRRKRSRARRKG